MKSEESVGYGGVLKEERGKRKVERVRLESGVLGACWEAGTGLGDVGEIVVA